MTWRYALHGLVVDSDVDLRHPRLSDGLPDLLVRREEPREVPAVVPEGDLVILTEVDGRPTSCCVHRPDGVHQLRLSGLLDVELDLRGPGPHTARWHPAPDADLDLVPVLVSGLLMSLYLLLQGTLVLHASAVRLPSLDGALALVGSSGMGKSTVATLLARDGAALITDDVLRVEPSEAGFVCHAGATETRLREKARELADGSGRETADGRLAVSLPGVDEDVLPLRCLAVPLPDRELSEVRLERVTGVRALMTLAQHPRVLGWRDGPTAQRQFDQLGALAKHVPVFLARLPWGPPFPPLLAQDLRTAVENALDAATGGAGA